MSRLSDLLDELERHHQRSYSGPVALPHGLLGDIVQAHREEKKEAATAPSFIQETEAALVKAIRAGESGHAATFHAMLRVMKEGGHE